MRQGKVYYKDHLAGTITETNEGEFVFQYDLKYVKEHPGDFITFTMPVTDKLLFGLPMKKSTINSLKCWKT